MARDVHFDGWTLRCETGELARGSQRVRLQGQPLQVLEALLEQPGELVTREQLIARLWPNGVIVDFDTALNSAVRRLRTALGDHAESPRYIETIPRRGYRFIAQLDAGPDGSLRTNVPASIPSSAQLAAIAPVQRVQRRVLLVAAAMVIIVLSTFTGWLAVSPGSTAPTATPLKSASVPAAARERYERGRFFLERRGTGDTARALELFEEALRIEPAYAEAWAGIAAVRWLDTVEGRVASRQGLALTRDAAERALQVDPSNAEATLRLANYHRAMGDQASGEALVRRAARNAPDDPLLLAFQASDAATAGRFTEAVVLQRRAVQNRPLDIPRRYNLAVWLFLAGQYEDARAELASIDAINPPRPAPHTLIGQMLLLQGDYRATLEYAQALPTGIARAQLEALAYFGLGRRAEADAALARLASQVPDRMAYLVAEVHAYRAEPDAAIAWLQRSAQSVPGTCQPDECWPSNWVPVLPLLRPLHSDPRWRTTSDMLVNGPSGRPVVPGPSSTAARR